MADFSFLSDTDDESVERILAEAKDHVILEQVAAINLSGVSDSALPSHLEKRFSRLKTFPASSSSSSQKKTQLASGKTLPPPAQQHPDTTERVIGDSNSSSTPSADDKLTDVRDVGGHKLEKQRPEDEKLGSGSGKNTKSRSSRRRRHVPSSPSSNESSLENESPVKGRRKEQKGRRKGLEYSSGSDDVRSSVSPPRITGCLWCSPKKLGSKSRSGGSKRVVVSSRRRSRKMEDDELDWEFTDEVLKDMNSFSFKEQKRLLKKAVEEQEKISREAEKIVKMARQASARMDAAAGPRHAIGRGSDDEFSD